MRHLTSFSNYNDYVAYTNNYIDTLGHCIVNVAYIPSISKVLYWFSIESIWGVLFGGTWLGGKYLLGSNPTLTGVPAIPDGHRITSMSGMFGSNPLIQEISKFNISNVTNVNSAFRGLYNLTKIFNNEYLDFSNCTDFDYFLAGTSKLKSINTSFASGTTFSNTFNGTGISLNTILALMDSDNAYGGSNYDKCFANTVYTGDSFTWDCDKISASANARDKLNYLFLNVIIKTDKIPDVTFTNVKIDLGCGKYGVSLTTATNYIWDGIHSSDKNYINLNISLSEDIILDNAFKNVYINKLNFTLNGHGILSCNNPFNYHPIYCYPRFDLSLTTSINLITGAGNVVFISGTDVGNPPTYDFSNCTNADFFVLSKEFLIELPDGTFVNNLDYSVLPNIINANKDYSALHMFYYTDGGDYNAVKYSGVMNKLVLNPSGTNVITNALEMFCGNNITKVDNSVVFRIKGNAKSMFQGCRYLNFDTYTLPIKLYVNSSNVLNISGMFGGSGTTSNTVYNAAMTITPELHIYDINGNEYTKTSPTAKINAYGLIVYSNIETIKGKLSCDGVGGTFYEFGGWPTLKNVEFNVIGTSFNFTGMINLTDQSLMSIYNAFVNVKSRSDYSSDDQSNPYKVTLTTDQLNKYVSLIPSASTKQDIANYFTNLGYNVIENVS